VTRCHRGAFERRQWGHVVNRLDHCRACHETDRAHRRIIAIGDAGQLPEPRPALWERLGTFPSDHDVATAPSAWLRYLRVGSTPPEDILDA